MTSTNRMNASGKSHKAQTVPLIVTAAVARKIPLVDKPAPANVPPASDPSRMPVNTQVLENEITAPLRRRFPLENGVERHEDEGAGYSQDTHDRKGTAERRGEEAK